MHTILQTGVIVPTTVVILISTCEIDANITEVVVLYISVYISVSLYFYGLGANLSYFTN